MTGRQRVVTALRRQIPDRVPFGCQNGAAAPALERLRRESGLDDPIAWANLVAFDEAAHDFGQY